MSSGRLGRMALLFLLGGQMGYTQEEIDKYDAELDKKIAEAKSKENREYTKQLYTQKQNDLADQKIAEQKQKQFLERKQELIKKTENENRQAGIKKLMTPLYAFIPQRGAGRQAPKREPQRQINFFGSTSQPRRQTTKAPAKYVKVGKSYVKVKSTPKRKIQTNTNIWFNNSAKPKTKKWF